MIKSHDDKSVSVGAALCGVLAAALASGAAILSGGLGSGALGLLAVGPVLVWLFWGSRAVFGAVLASLLGMGGIWILQGNGLLPPPLLKPSLLLVWVSVGLPILYGVSVFLRLRRDRTLSGPPTLIEPEVAVHQPPANIAANAPWLRIDISPFGRIRRIEGDTSLLPNLRMGGIADLQLIDATGIGLIDGENELADASKIYLRMTESPAGKSILIVPADDMPDPSSGQLEQKLRDRTDFFASLGHDLKSPLNAVIGFAEMMETEIRGPMPEPYKDYPGLIRESGQTLLRLVEDMLGFARSEAGTYEIDPSPMDIVASGETVMRQSMADAERAGVTLKMTAKSELLAYADAGAVQRIWDNLVSNAIKYSTSGGTVTLAGKRRAQEVQFSVTDQGAGMDADDLARIAKPFEQGRNARGRAGSGLGLAMVKRLADMHGGKVMIRTAPGEGTQVTVTLPAAVERDQEAAE